MDKAAGMCLRSCGIVLALLLALSVQGCAHKAKAIQAGAAQFEVESLAAVDRIEEMHVLELSTTPMTTQQSSKSFINSVETDDDGSISLRDLRDLVNPGALDLHESEAEWQEFLSDLRNQYTTFAVTFTSLDKGSLFAREHVGKTAPFLSKLIVQLVSFAESVSNNPPEFNRMRAEIGLELDLIKENTKSSDEVKRLRYLDVERRLRALAAEEARVAKESIEQCLKAAKIGMELKELLLAYDQLSLDDISEALELAFRLAGHISGADLSDAKGMVDAALKEVREDPDLNALFNVTAAQLREMRPAKAGSNAVE